MDRLGFGSALAGFYGAVLLLPIPVGALVLSGQIEAQPMEGIQHQQARDGRFFGAGACDESAVEVEWHPIAGRF